VTSTAFDVKFLARTKSLIEKYGKSVTFYPVTEDTDGSSYDETTGTTPADDTPASGIATKCIIDNAKTTSRGAARRGQKILYVPAADFELSPKEGDSVLIDDERWFVIGIDSYYSGEQAAMYGVQVNRS
jgi:hypothetical protein